MANHFPLIINSTTSAIEELAIGDNLDLTGSAIVGANTLTTEGLITTNTGVQFPDGTIQTTAGGGGSSSGNVWVTSNITSFVAGAGLNFAVDYTNPTYPGGVFTLYQVSPIVPLYWKYTNATPNPNVTTSDPHGDITFVINATGSNNGIGVNTTTTPNVNTWIFIPDSITVPYFKYDQPPFYGIVFTPEGQPNPDYNIYPGVATLNGVSYTGYEFFTAITGTPVFIYTASI